MSKQLRWKTISKLNAYREGHTWHIYLVGKPEIKYTQDTLLILHNAGFVCRFTNHSLDQNYTNVWYADPSKHNVVIEPNSAVLNYILPADIVWKERDRCFVSRSAGEVLARQGESISIMAYKRTTHLEFATRKEVF